MMSARAGMSGLTALPPFDRSVLTVRNSSRPTISKVMPAKTSIISIKRW
jgi:hypothetical protein